MLKRSRTGQKLQLHDRRRVDQHAGHRVGEENQLYIWYFKRGNVYRPFCTHARTTKSSMLSPRRGVAQSEGQGQSPYRTREARHPATPHYKVYMCRCTLYSYTIALHTTISTWTALQQRAVALASAAQGTAVAATLRRHEAARVRRRRRRGWRRGCRGGGEEEEERGEGGRRKERK